MPDDHEPVLSVVTPPPVTFIGRCLHCHALALRGARKSEQRIDAGVHRGPERITPAQVWSLHRPLHEFSCFGKQVGIRENVNHFCEARRQPLCFTVCASATKRHQRTLFVIAADQFDSSPRALLRENLFNDEVGTRPLRQEIADENDAAVATQAGEPLKHLRKFFAAAVHVSNHDRVSHPRRIRGTMSIRLLPAALVNQIAAGEVVERPASVAKELIENALDAGATKIAIRIEAGGRELLAVSDDGRGIPRDELTLALAAHATSKIATSDDLNRIFTFGFRGEALSAIAAVAHFTLSSCTAGEPQAWSIESRFGAVEPPKPAAGGVGTRIEVRGLFTNVPARRHFLRSDSAEAARVTEVVCNAALANPTVAFRLESSARKVLDLEAAADSVGRVWDVLGEALGREPLTVVGEAINDDGLRATIMGSICRPAAMRAVSRTQRIFVNGRPIVDRSLMHAVREAYRGLAEPSLQPVFVIFLQVDPAMVDVNVHPQKSEVRWRSPAAMHRLVYRSVQDALRLADLTAEGSGLLGIASPQLREPIVAAPHAVRAHSREVIAAVSAERAVSAPQTTAVRLDELDDQRTARTDAELFAPPKQSQDVLQIDETWLVFAEDGALVIVDQHALHERVMFEEIRARIGRRDLMSQRLLVPATADVPPEALARLDAIAPLFARLGIEVVAAGPRSIAVHAFPGFLSGRGVNAAEFVARALTNEQLASALESNDSASLRESALADVLDTMACKAAIKGGDRLSQAEIARLLAARSATDRATNCPHGRPTSVRIPLADIERRFGRR